MNEHVIAKQPTGRPQTAPRPSGYAGRIAVRTLMWLFLLATALLTLFPLLMTLTGSLKTGAEMMTGGSLLPAKLQFANYAEAWKQANFARYTWNSAFMSVMVTVGTLLVASMAAYVVDRRNFPGKRIYVTVQASMMFISVGAIVLRPQFDLMVALHLNTTLWGVILILVSAHSSTFFMLQGFFKAIPGNWMKRLWSMAPASSVPFPYHPATTDSRTGCCRTIRLPPFVERIHPAAGIHHDQSEAADADCRAGESPLRLLGRDADPSDDGRGLPVHSADAAGVYSGQ